MCTPQKLIVTTFFKTMFVRICVKQDGFEMTKTLIWPFRNGQAISKPLKSFKTAMAVSKRPKVSKWQVTEEDYRKASECHIML